MKENGMGESPERIAAEKEWAEMLKFKEYFPGSEIREVGLEEVPDGVRSQLEKMSRRNDSSDSYKEGNFSKVYEVATGGPAEKTYVARQKNDYGGVVGTMELTYAVDVVDGKVAGQGEMVLRDTDDEDFKDKPRVNYTETEEDFRRLGLGMRRLFLMNGLAQMNYGKPLHSDTTEAPGSRSLWEKLVAQGLAKKTEEDANRYVFLDDAKFSG